MPSNDRQVFDHLTAQADSGSQQRQIAFLTYALFAFEKREWIILYKSKHDGAEPTQSDIDGWISNITESTFTTWRGAAERYFVDAADELFEERLTQAREEILRSVIVTEVKDAGSWQRQLAIALATAILAPIIIGGIIASAIVYDKNIVTVTSVADHIENATKPAAPSNPGK